MRGKITKLSTNENAFRGESMEGRFFRPPFVGERFTMEGKAIDERMDVRILRTSVVQEIRTEPDVEGVILRTENSVYQLETYEDSIELGDIFEHAKGRQYRVVGFCKIKNTKTRAWEEGLMYFQLPMNKPGENPIYVRTKDDFFERFKKVRRQGDPPKR